MRPITLLSEPLLLLRDKAGKVSALRNICPHRAMPLSYGRFDGEAVECCYHGWRFGTDGRCTHIPSLIGDEGIEPSNIAVRHYPVIEQQGGIWIYCENPGTSPPKSIALPPRMPGVGDRAPNLTESLRFPCNMDNAVIGLLDPAHVPYVHESWWWRKRGSHLIKAKPFGPVAFGFAMKRHAPSKNSLAYRLLGGRPETEIRFQLPGTRIEHITIGRHHVVNLTTVTPITEKETEITNSLWWTQAWLNPFTPLVRSYARAFLGQDERVVVMQQEGLQHDRAMMLIKDADTQSRWYFQMKAEYERAATEGREFTNPVPDVTLRWRT